MSENPKVQNRATTPESAVSTGSTLLNLAISDHTRIGFTKGGYYYLVGDSMSGKTWFSMTCFAEACLNPAFSDYDLIFDDVEGGAQMDIEGYFGKEVARRLQAPAKDAKGNKVHSDTVESFYHHLTDRLAKGRKFIYVLDSQDALTSTASEAKFVKRKTAIEQGNEAKGSYGDGKAKFHSEHLRIVLSKIRKLGCILIIIGQTRDNLGFGFAEKTRAGGRALRFYANLEIWTSVIGKVQKIVRGQKRTVGSKVQVELKKNRVTGKIGKDRSVIVPFTYGLGIDDVGSCVDFLVKEKHWKKSNGSIDAKEIGAVGGRTEIIRQIEDKGQEPVLRKLTGKVWRQVEAECNTARKKRYL